MPLPAGDGRARRRQLVPHGSTQSV